MAKAQENKEVKKSKKISLKFIKNCSPYVKGDIAGFGKKTAEKYIERGVANRV